MTVTRVDVRCAAGGLGAVEVHLGHGLLQARRLRAPAGVVRVALVAGQALLLAGDAVRVEVRVSGPVRVEVVETAGTVAYDARGGTASWAVDAQLVDGAVLVWRGEPFVVAGGADVDRSTTVTLAPGCAAVLRESLVLGRTGEAGGVLRARTRVDLHGVPLVAEDLRLAGGATPWAVLGGHRCLDVVTAAGTRLADGPGVLQAEGEGSVARWLGDEQHLSPLGPVLAAAADGLRTCAPVPA